MRSAACLLALFSCFLSVMGLYRIGYYPVYEKYNFPPNTIDYAKLTQIAIGYLNPNATGDLVPPDWVQSEWEDFSSQTSTLAHNAGIKTLLFLGGAGGNVNCPANGPWNIHTQPACVWHQTNRSSSSTQNTVNAFAQKIVSYAQARGYDGVDFDWEECLDYEGLTRLTSAVRALWPDAFLTFPLGPYELNLTGLALVATQGGLDGMNVMSYIPPGNWPGWDGPWHLGPLSGWAPAHPYAIDHIVNAMRGAGIPSSLIGIGIGFYGTCWGPPITQPVQPLGSNQPIATDNTMSQRNIYQYYRDNMQYNWDDVAKNPFLNSSTAVPPNGCTYISYDDPASIRAKGEYAVAEGLAGVIVWTIAQGVLINGSNPALDALYTYFPSGSTTTGATNGPTGGATQGTTGATVTTGSGTTGGVPTNAGPTVTRTTASGTTNNGSGSSSTSGAKVAASCLPALLLCLFVLLI